MFDYRRSVARPDGRGGGSRRRTGNVLATKETDETMNFRRNIRRGVDPGGRAEIRPQTFLGSGGPGVNRCHRRNFRDKMFSCCIFCNS